MRKDMKKIITSRPRVGGFKHNGRNKLHISDLDENYEIDDNYPRKISAKSDALGGKGGKGHPKEQTDHMSPVIRFLHKQIGRPWDEVWSEICENSKDFMGDHLKRHIKWEVATECCIDEKGKITDIGGYEIKSWKHDDLLYVHPETGILSIEKRKSPRYEKPKSKIITIDKQEYYKHNGIWYRVETKRLPEKSDLDKCIGIRKDVFYNFSTLDYFGHIRRKSVELYGSYVICVKKEQANSKECKTLNKIVN